jgi:hypothetical protein
MNEKKKSQQPGENVLKKVPRMADEFLIGLSLAFQNVPDQEL